MLRVGFIGMGNMGLGMALNVAKQLPKIHPQSCLTVYDNNPSHCISFMQEYANYTPSREGGNPPVGRVQKASSVVEVAEVSDVILLSLPSEKICEEVLFGEEGIAFAWGRGGSTAGSRAVIDHANNQKLRESVRNVEYLDAPVSGGPGGARDGTLTIMCGGDEDEFSKQSPLLGTMGANVMYFGASGAGTAAKLVNQCLVTAHAQAAAEAIHMAESLNLIDLGKRSNDSFANHDANNIMEKEERLIKMLSNSWGQSRVLELLLHDYISIKRIPDKGGDSGESFSAADRPSEMVPPSGAPLRNLDKDMTCALSDLRDVISSRSHYDNIDVDVSNSLAKEFPVISQSAQQVSRACDDKKPLLSHGPFLSLIELLRQPSHQR